MCIFYFYLSFHLKECNLPMPILAYSFNHEIYELETTKTTICMKEKLIDPMYSRTLLTAKTI